jgi:hypothetical protein
MRPRVSAVSALLLWSVTLVACRASDPPSRPEETCARACVERARAVCTEGECERGCRLALDRLIEKEGERVLACVAASKNRRCDDLLWADCAVRIGAHADGGPPPPPKPKTDDEDDL